MLLTDKEYLKLHRVLIIISDVIAGGYKGNDGFIKKAKVLIKNTDIEIDLIQKVAVRLELITNVLNEK